MKFVNNVLIVDTVKLLAIVDASVVCCHTALKSSADLLSNVSTHHCWHNVFLLMVIWWYWSVSVRSSVVNWHDGILWRLFCWLWDLVEELSLICAMISVLDVVVIFFCGKDKLFEIIASRIITTITTIIACLHCEVVCVCAVVVEPCVCVCVCVLFVLQEYCCHYSQYCLPLIVTWSELLLSVIRLICM